VFALGAEIDAYLAETAADLSEAASVEAQTTRADEVIAPAVKLSVDPDVLTPGRQPQAWWALEGIALETGTPISLRLSLPESFSLEGKYEGQFDAASHVLTIPVTALTGQVHLKAGSTTERVTIQAALLKNAEVIAEASLPLSAHEQFALDPKGGSIQVRRARASRSSSRRCVLRESHCRDRRAFRGRGASIFLRVHAVRDQGAGTADPDEAQQVSQEITIRGFVCRPGYPEGQEDNLCLYWYNPETETGKRSLPLWQEKRRPSRRSPIHFTVFDIGVDTGRPRGCDGGLVPGVELYRCGDVFPAIVVPSGPGGFSASLSLN